MFLKQAHKILSVFALAMLGITTAAAQIRVCEVFYNDTKTYSVEETLGSTYTWQINDGQPLAGNGNSIDITWNNTFYSSITADQTYTLTVKERDAHNCDGAVVELQVIVKQLELRLEQASDICQGEDLIFTASPIPDVTFHWEVNGEVQTGITTNVLNLGQKEPGTYTVSVSVVESTVAPETATVQVHEVPVVNNITAQKASVCQGADLVLTANSSVPTATYTWTVNGVLMDETGNELHYTTKAPGTLAITAIAENQGCVAPVETMQATVIAAPVPKTMDYGPECATPGQLNVNTLASAAGRKNWYAGETAVKTITPPVIDTNEPKVVTYWVSSSTPQGCESERVPVQVAIYENPVFIPDAVAMDGNRAEIRVEGGTPPYIYKLRGEESESAAFFGNTIMVEGLVIGKNPIVIEDANLCIASAELTAQIDLIPDKYFSPNDDGINDYWMIQNIESYPKTEIIIRDRYGKELARYRGKDFRGWDGKYNGNKVISDDYWYEIQVHEVGARMIGHFNLRR